MSVLGKLAKVSLSIVQSLVSVFICLWTLSISLGTLTTGICVYLARIYTSNARNFIQEFSFFICAELLFSSRCERALRSAIYGLQCAIEIYVCQLVAYLRNFHQFLVDKNSFVYNSCYFLRVKLLEIWLNAFKFHDKLKRDVFATRQSQV